VFAPQLPPDWPAAEVRNVAVGGWRCDLSVKRSPGRLGLGVTCRGGGQPLRLVAAPAFPPDARIRSVSSDGRVLTPEIVREGDVQRARVTVEGFNQGSVVFELDEGTEAFVPAEPPAAGARNRGLRLLRSSVERGALRLVVEGRAGGADTILVRSPRQPEAIPGVGVEPAGAGLWRLTVRFESPGGEYVRRELSLPLP
jgi:hypothetical protein